MVGQGGSWNIMARKGALRVGGVSVECSPYRGPPKVLFRTTYPTLEAGRQRALGRVSFVGKTGDGSYLHARC